MSDVIVRNIYSPLELNSASQVALTVIGDDKNVTVNSPDTGTTLRIESYDSSLVVHGDGSVSKLIIEEPNAVVVGGAVQGVAGPPGIQGPPGIAGVVSVSVRNMDTVSLRKCTLVSITENSDVVRTNIATNYRKIIGFVSSDNIDVGSYGIVQINGILEASTGDWEDATNMIGPLLLGPYYASSNIGEITNSADINNNLIQVGRAMSGTSLYIDIETPIII